MAGEGTRTKLSEVIRKERDRRSSFFMRQVLHEVLDLASEVRAEPIDGLCASSITLLIQNFRQGHSVQASGTRNFVDGDAPSLSELLLFDHFRQFESNHD
jgi:hypothetical protein